MESFSKKEMVLDMDIERIKDTLEKECELRPSEVKILLGYIQNLEGKINRVVSSLGHELYGHILQNDEETWNKEFYTDGKLDYRKLLISLLNRVFEILEVDGSKWYDYDD